MSIVKEDFYSEKCNRIENEAFNFDSKLEYLYYEGNKDDWGKIEIGEYNDSLLAETTKYYITRISYRMMKRNGIIR